MPNIVVIGAQWGDEGKGKVVDVITPHVNVVVRFQGGNNAGHTVVVGSPRTGAGELLALDLKGGGERTLAIADVLADPGKSFEGVGGQAHA